MSLLYRCGRLASISFPSFVAKPGRRSVTNARGTWSTCCAASLCFVLIFVLPLRQSELVRARVTTYAGTAEAIGLRYSLSHVHKPKGGHPRARTVDSEMVVDSASTSAAMRVMHELTSS